MADIGVLITGLNLAVQNVLFEGLAARGHPHVRPRHGAVLAHLGDGARATELAERSGRSKQTVARLVDELEQLGYVRRRADPRDRRGKIVVPTEAAIAEVAAARDILARLERAWRDALGADAYAEWRAGTERLIDVTRHRPGSSEHHVPEEKEKEQNG